jgi:hypothetical protein
MRDLLNIRNGAIENGQYGAAVAAEKLRAQMGGLLNEKRDDPMKLMSKEQIEKETRRASEAGRSKDGCPRKNAGRNLYCQALSVALMQHHQKK